MGLPPRTADLWRQGQQLRLWGDDEDSDEQKMIENANAALSQQGFDMTKMNAEEVLMLANGGDSGREPLQCIKKWRPCPPPSPPPQPLPPPRPTKPPLNCTTPLDFVLVLDESGSMFSFMEGVGGLKHFAKELVRH